MSPSPPHRPRLLLAFDKFKGSLSAQAACAAAAEAVRRVEPNWQVDEAPLTDGGEGFCSLLTRSANGSFHSVQVTGPLGTAVQAELGVVHAQRLTPPTRNLLNAKETDRIGVLEMATASGLARVPENQRDVWKASSRGTGELLLEAARLSVDRILLGIGGSATSDLGLGALSALGVRFDDAQGHDVDPIPQNWLRIRRVERHPIVTAAGSLLGGLPPLSVACDVRAPLFGRNGAAAVYGSQKGLRTTDLESFESQAQSVAHRTAQALDAPEELALRAGAGAAGGMGWALMAARGARLVPGFELVASWLDLDSRISRSDLVFTGEGRFDDSSLTGKGPFGVVERARHAGKRCVIFAGAVQLTDPFPTETIAVTPSDLPMEQAQSRAGELLRLAVTQWARSQAPA